MFLLIKTNLQVSVKLFWLGKYLYFFKKTHTSENKNILEMFFFFQVEVTLVS